MLTSFNKIVLTIATIVLSISLIALGIFLSKSMFENSYPPVISDCPDYWDVSFNSNNETICENISTINRGSQSSDCRKKAINMFSTNGSNINDVMCEKYTWAKDCDITWDGVTNNNKACDKAKLG